MMKTMVILGLFLLLLGSTVVSQTREARVLADLKWSVVVHADGKLAYGDLENNPTTTQTGVNIPGSVCGFGLTGSTTQYLLLAGRDSQGSGIIQCWNKTGTASVYSLSSTATHPGDFCGIVYDVESSLVYVLNCNPSVIWKFSWNGLDNLPSSGWALLATPTQVPELNDSGYYDLSLDMSQTPYRLELGVWQAFADGDPDRVFITGDNPNNIVVTRDEPSANGMRFSVNRRSMTEQGNSIRVTGSVGVNVELVNYNTGVVLGSATIGSTGEATITASSQPFTIGDHYCVREAGTKSELQHCFRCYRRYGRSEILSNGVRIGETPHPLGCYVGSTEFLAWTPLLKDVVPTADCHVTGFMGFAFRDPVTGLDPVIQIGQNHFLITSTCIAVTGSIFSGSNQGGIHGTLSIPNDPTLVGQVLLIQFWLDDGGTAKVSNILGMRLDYEKNAIPIALGAAHGNKK